jgi:uncharacterized protein YjbI with pentapeptide repeats
MNEADISGEVLKDENMNNSNVVNFKIKKTDMTGANLYDAHQTRTKFSEETLKDA